MDSATRSETSSNANYGEAFPTLPGQAIGKNPASSASSWTSVAALKPNPPRISSSTVTQVFHIPALERRYKNQESAFGSDQQEATCKAISKAHDVKIETNLARDESLTVMVTGRPGAVRQAKKDIYLKLQTQANGTIQIPKEHYRFVLGAKGAKLTQLELDTSTKIQIPRTDNPSDMITITGNKEGIEVAKHEIQLISDEQAKLAFERLTVPKMYHPFIQGPANARAKKLAESTNTRINIPPSFVNKDDITVAGEKEGVAKAVEEIQTIYNNKRQKCQTVSVEVNKKQHKYVIGPKGQGIHEVMEKYDVSIEMPPSDSSSVTITLRGEPQALGPALSLVYTKANSVVSFEIAAPDWLHRFIIGKGGSNIKKIMDQVPKVHIEFVGGEDKILLEGPPEEVTVAQKELEPIVADLKRTMAHDQVAVNKKYHRNIIGKNGSNRQRMMAETNTNIRIPNEDDTSDIIYIEGDPAGVKVAKAEIMELAKKMDDEKTREILIEQRFHRILIGQKGEAIKEVRDLFNQVQISLPKSGDKSDVVSLRGPSKDVEQCYKYLDKWHKDLVVNNHVAEVRIFKDFHKNVIGKGGATIKKIKDDTDTKIDLPNQMSNSDTILITGKKENVKKAKEMIEKIQKELANIAEETIIVPHKLHNAVIGAKGRYIKAIMDECGGVLIRFPAESTGSDKVVIRGPKDDVANAKKQLLELVDDRKINNYTAEIKAKPEYHKFLIGRQGVNIKKVREKYGARVVFPTMNDDQPEVISLIGKQESVAQAKVELEAMIKELENIVDDTVEVPVKWHKNFVARRGELLNQLAAEFGGVSVSFPRSGSTSETVRLHGAKECVVGAKKRIEEIVAEYESQVTVDCVIEQKHHRHVMGARGSNVQEITKQFNVQIKFPDRLRPDRPPRYQNGAQNAEQNGVQNGVQSGSMNGDTAAVPREEQDGDTATISDAAVVPIAVVEEKSPTTEEPTDLKQDIIVITGKKDDVEEARLALIALVPVTKEMDILFEFHRFIIGQKGKDIRQMMDKHDVNISIPPSNNESDTVKVTGTVSKVDKALDALKERVKELEAEKADKDARQYTLEINVDPKFHPKIIGKQGAVIKKLRTDYEDVNIQMPAKMAEEPDKIVIQGYERAANAAKVAILKIVADLESLMELDVDIDSRIHNRIIGSRGSAVRKLMEQYNVDIKFPRSNDPNPNKVTITGKEDDVYDCEDELLNLEEEYIQEFQEKEELAQFTKPKKLEAPPPPRGDGKGFTVQGAPWEKSNKNFPGLGGASNSTAPAGPWGKK